MTAIAYRDGVMAADTVGWTAQCRIKVPVRPKVIRVRDGLMACAGSSDEIEAWCAHMRDQDRTTPPEFVRDDDFTALLAKRDGSLWLCGYRQRWSPIATPFFAIGACDTFMWGALYGGASADEAVRLAILHTDGAGGEVQVERL